MENVKKQLDDLVQHIQSEVLVKEIIVFGSRARGEAGKDSDIDLCIITDQMDERRIDIIRKIRKAIAPVTSIPVDILVYSENEFDERGHHPSTFEYQIKNEGIAVHE